MYLRLTLAVASLAASSLVAQAQYTPQYNTCIVNAGKSTVQQGMCVQA